MRKKRLLCLGVLPVVLACTSSNNTGPGAAGSTRAAVSGPADAHCAGKQTVVVDPGVCKVVAEAGAGDDAGTGAGGYGDTMYNSEGDDDDCKYHLKWTSSDVAQNQNVTFSAVITTKKDGTPLKAAPVEVEVFLDDKHPAPNTDSKSTEGPDGTYSISPVKFDAAGKWTVRFHMHDECNDSETSPHGHAAFFVQVP
jgi:hypothetical protein